jgi:hydroxypyruvate reductase
MIIKPGQLATYSLLRSSRGEDICRILAGAINGVDAGEAINKHVTRDANHLIIDNKNYDLNKYKRVFVIGTGKACIPMANAIYNILKDKITSGLLITKDKHLNSEKYHFDTNFEIREASHPIPDQRNLDAAIKLINLASELNSNDLVIILLSGGGSSLLMNPSSGISLQDVQTTTAILLSCGVSIYEMNTIRKHLDMFKGGGLVKYLTPATVVSLILSDVVGDNLEVIASGPTVADPTTFADAWAILNTYQIVDMIPPRIRSQILAGIHGEIQETIKPSAPILNKVSNYIVGNNSDAVSSALATAKLFGFDTRVLTNSFQGEASKVGKFLSEEAINMLSPLSSMTRPACLISGGESTVTIRGTGKGGRNQELALGATKSLSGSDQLILASLATDGGDGPTDAAGAVTTHETYSRGLVMGLDPDDYLRMNDSYHYFEFFGDLIKTGPTLTNVNDLVVIFGL